MRSISGSSPYIRGTQPQEIHRALCARFIPVHTGNTSCEISISTLSSVHPRAYGEHSFKIPVLVMIDGSSPCIRGTLVFSHDGYVFLRFIPVHTGNTLRMSFFPCHTPVHPRAYGEHALSPPLSGKSIRFIPVHTGNT